jgi:hypothetical protein
VWGAVSEEEPRGEGGKSRRLNFPIGWLAFCCLRLCLMGHVIGWVLGVGFEIELKDGKAGHLAWFFGEFSGIFGRVEWKTVSGWNSEKGLESWIPQTGNRQNKIFTSQEL